MKKLWSSDTDTDEQEKVEEFPLRDDDLPRYAYLSTCELNKLFYSV